MTDQPRDGVKWEDPPPPRPRYDWASINDKLRDRPGEWLLVFEQDRTSLTTTIKAGGIRLLAPDKGIEVRTANNKRGSPRLCDLYLKYNPEKEK